MRTLTAMIMLLYCSIVNAQTRTFTYTESQEDIVNPERGFYIPTGTKASRFQKLDETVLRSYRTTEQRPGSASYGVKVSLVYRGYELDIYKDRPLADSFLVNLQGDFNTIRKAGLKMILRFMYTNESKSGDCPDQYQICPPYGDAPRHIVLGHIKQLQPLLQKNADVIAVLQEGFIGIWGENYFTDYFGDASTNGAGKILDSSWQHRNELLKALLDAMPRNRMVQVRTPQIKQKFVYGPSAPTSSAPLDSAAAFNGSDASRVAFHNDCFLASEDDYGTYYDNGSSTQPRGAATEVLRKYIEADTKYTVVGGETCDDAFSPQNDCAPAGYAEAEMRRMHYSYLNASYNNNVNNDWDSAGCMYNIKRQIGYRLVLRKLEVPEASAPGNPISVKFTLENTGYAVPYNPRPVVMILRNKATGREYRQKLEANPQKWFSGLHEWTETILLPRKIRKGNYQMFLILPDESKQIADRPEYCIRFANEHMFDESTGYMDLKAELSVATPETVQAY